MMLEIVKGLIFPASNLTVIPGGTLMFVRKSLRQVGFTLLASAVILTACNLGSTPAPTVDVNAINTAAVETAMGQLSAQFTQTALAGPATPTNTPQSLPTFQLPTANGTAATPGGLPTVSFNSTPNTPIPGFTPLASPLAPTSAGIGSTASGCNDAAFTGENLPDKSEVTAGEEFTKSWELLNTGTCTWEIGYTFTFLAAESTAGIDGYDVVIRADDETTDPGHSQSFVVKIDAPENPGEYFGYWKLKDKDGKFFGPRVYLDVIVK
jgi:hypothetical protein